MSGNQCKFCGKDFSARSSLNTHIKTAYYCLKSRGEIASIISCKYCNKEFSVLSNLKVHINSCRVKKKIEKENVADQLQNFKLYHKKWKLLEVKYKSEIRSLHSNVENSEKIVSELALTIEKIQKENLESMEKSEKYKQEINSRDEKIIQLEKTIGFGKGMMIGYKEIKPPNITNNTIVNQKLASVKIAEIRPATISTITEDSSYYDFNMYLKKEDGIVQFLTNMTQLKLEDGTVEQNYACTDKSRSTFHRLLGSREWTLDGGSKLINEVFDILLPMADEHWKTLINKSMTRDISDREYYANKIDELRNFHHSFGRQTKERKYSVNKIKGEIKHILSI